ncbi:MULTISPECIES: DUF6153 family protein [Streptomyces]|uniref:DUF1328 domain-containing protein n=1 Tax=Streptomyces dengpaensis TaxID=2049881 RepID=A0ABN5ID15_9ACTN|nr:MULTISPECIES: DUF6153 family protein [Streptomyces]AVH61051.1 hypothetical protein C4B68_08245 [Streptomyces dengpaensis]PIB12312.1 hypothetical protein B1C81_02185 [Streptomyces sp. HG99]
MASSVPPHNRPAGRLLGLLVLAVLTGVLGMHALAPGGGLAMPAEAGHEMVMAQPDGVPHVGGGCSHTDGGADHPAHADGTCAASGTGSAYTPPALTGALQAEPGTSSLMVRAVASAQSGRAPPDLSELQLLRI